MAAAGLDRFRYSEDREQIFCAMAGFMSISQDADRPTVAVVIPAHNAADTISRAIRSIERQTVAVDDVILVDDHSEDNTVALVRERHAEVRVVASPGRYAGCARNHGVSMATSEWVAFLDADDVWYPRKIERQISLLAPDLILAGALCHYLAADGRVLGSNIRYESSDVALQDLRNAEAMPLHLCSLLVSRRRFLNAGGFDESFRRAQDFELAVRLAQQPGRIDWPRDEILVGYVMGGGSATATSYMEQALAAKLARARLRDGVFVSYEEWVKVHRGNPRERLQMRSGHHYRQAGIAIGDRRHARGVLNLAVAAAFDPAGVIRKLRWRTEGRGEIPPAEVPADVAADFLSALS